MKVIAWKWGASNRLGGKMRVGYANCTFGRKRHIFELSDSWLGITKRVMNLISLALVFLGVAVNPVCADPIVDARHGFSIEPPESWEVVRNQPGLTLLLHLPKSQEQEAGYLSTIQVIYQDQAISVDRFEAAPYATTIEARRKKAFSPDTVYKIESHDIIDLKNNQKAILFYSSPVDYMGKSLMEMHILVGSGEGHFLLTYTDLAEHFSSRDPGSPLMLAFESMTSFSVSEPTSGRFDNLIWFSSGIVFCLLFWLGSRIIQSRRLRGFEKEHEFVSDLSANSELLPPNVSPNKHLEDHVTAVSHLSDVNSFANKDRSMELSFSDLSGFEDNDYSQEHRSSFGDSVADEATIYDEPSSSQPRSQIDSSTPSIDLDIRITTDLEVSFEEEKGLLPPPPRNKVS